MSDTTKALTKSAAGFLSGTFISRVSGLLRDISMAYAFGTTPEVAAFMVAFRFSNLFRRLFGESALSASFIPHFEKVRTRESGVGFFLQFGLSLSVVLVALIFCLEGGLYLSLPFLSEGNRAIASLTMWMLPGLLFICLYALSNALLQCEKRYFLGAVAPIAFNVVWAGGALLVKDLKALSLLVTVAFFMQWMMTLPAVIAWVKSAGEKIKWQLFSKQVRALARPFCLGILGIGAMQINSALDALFARAADPEGPAYLWYAIRLQQVPLALFGIALSSALLPPLSRAIEKGDHERFHTLYRFTQRRCIFLMAAATCGLMIFGRLAIRNLFGHGGFSLHAVDQSTLCLKAYALGLVPAAMTLVTAPTFYARKDFKTPMIG